MSSSSALHEAAVGRQRASEVDAYAARLVLVFAILRSYTRMQQARAQRDNAEATLEQREQVVALTRQRVAAHLDSEVELKQAESQVPAAKVQIAQLNEAIALLRTELAALAGQGPDRGLALARPQLQEVRPAALPREDLEHAREAVRTARAALVAAQVKDAYIATVRTAVPAPVAGMVAKRNAQVGQRVAAGATLMTIVPVDAVWVTANFKGSQLRHLRSGQPVALTADAYGSGVVYHGTVVGEEAGTGSAFSLMPAQNATRNWIKVVQRVPARIALDPREVAGHPLQLGLSMRVTVDTTQRGRTRMTAGATPAQAYRTTVFAREDQDAAALVARIVDANSGGAHPAPGRRAGS